MLVDLGGEDESPLYWIIPARIAQRLIVNNQIPDREVEEFQGRWDLLDSEGLRHQRILSCRHQPNRDNPSVPTCLLTCMESGSEPPIRTYSKRWLSHSALSGQAEKW